MLPLSHRRLQFGALRSTRHRVNQLLQTKRKQRPSPARSELSFFLRMCEHVFSLLKAMFGDARDATLADMIQASLMLRYNGRLLA